jgi:hypothetical protein
MIRDATPASHQPRYTLRYIARLIRFGRNAPVRSTLIAGALHPHADRRAVNLMFGREAGFRNPSWRPGVHAVMGQIAAGVLWSRCAAGSYPVMMRLGEARASSAR